MNPSDIIQQIRSSWEAFLPDPLAPAARPVLVTLMAATLLLLMLILVLFLKRGRSKSTDLPARTDETPGQPDEARTDAAPADVEEVRATSREKWLAKLRQGLAKSSQNLRTNLSSLFTGKKIDEDLLEQLHETLYRADIGAKTTDYLVDRVRSTWGGGEAPSWDEVRHLLQKEVAGLLTPSSPPSSEPQEAGHPRVILIIGVNGVGKTTSIGKLGAHFLSEGKEVLFCAADTYRAAAIDQLKVWGERIGVDVIAHKQGADPAAVAWDATKAAVSREVDVLLVDTAGRLHNKSELMDELAKINRVLSKDLPGAPHETWLVIDATTGQNASRQVEAFSAVTGVTGLIVTKLDGTAKGGVIIGISHQYGLPVRYIGVGEQAADLRRMDPADFAGTLFE